MTTTTNRDQATGLQANAQPASRKSAQECPELYERLKQYYAEHVGKVAELLRKYRLTPDAQQAVLSDLWRRLIYADDKLQTIPENIKELREKVPAEELQGIFISGSFPLFFEIFQDYAKVLSILELAEDLGGFADGLESVKDQTKDQRQAVTELGKTFESQFNSMTYSAQLMVLEYLPENLVLIIKDGDHVEAAVRQYISFLLYAIESVEATDSELLQIIPGEPLHLDEKIRTDSIKKLRDGIEEEARQFKEDQTISNSTSNAAHHDAMLFSNLQGATTGERIVTLWQNVIETCSGPLRLAKKTKADATPTGEEVTRPKPKAQPLGTYSLKTAIARAQEQIDTEAYAQGKEPIKLSEERVYQCLNGLQILANEYGQPVATKDSVEYFQYETSLRKIAAVCYGTDTPNAELIRQTYESLRILATNYVAFEEKRIKNVRVDGPEGVKITKPVTKTYRHYVQLVIMPQISLRTNPDGTVNNDIGVATATIWVHSVLRTGRRQSAPVINDGKKEYIQTPRQQYITYEQLQHSLRFFKSHDGSGRRFFSMILAKNHKNEDDILEEIFDYSGKVEKAVKAAENRAKKRIEKQERQDIGGFVAQLVTTGTTKEQAIKLEVEKETKAAEKKAKRSIMIHKTRDRETLVLWFSQAVELNVIEPNPKRTASKSKPGTFVWEWERTKTKKITAE